MHEPILPEPAPRRAIAPSAGLPASRLSGAPAALRTGATVPGPALALAAVLLSAALVACGDSDDDDGDGTDDASAGPVVGTETGPGTGPDMGAPPSPAGLWRGTTGDGRALEGLVLADGEFRFVYSAPDDPDTLGGVIAGDGTVDGTALTASRALDYGLGDEVGIEPFALEATFSPRATLDGTATYEGGTSSFTSAYDADFERPASLEALAGIYDGIAVSELGPVGATLSIDPEGALAGDTDDGCTFAGRFVPREDANAHDVAIEAAGDDCLAGTDALAGLAFLEDGVGGQLVAVLRDPALAAVTVFLGRRAP